MMVIVRSMFDLLYGLCVFLSSQAACAIQDGGLRLRCSLFFGRKNARRWFLSEAAACYKETPAFCGKKSCSQVPYLPYTTKFPVLFVVVKTCYTKLHVTSADPFRLS